MSSLIDSSGPNKPQSLVVSSLHSPHTLDDGVTGCLKDGHDLAHGAVLLTKDCSLSSLDGVGLRLGEGSLLGDSKHCLPADAECITQLVPRLQQHDGVLCHCKMAEGHGHWAHNEAETLARRDCPVHVVRVSSSLQLGHVDGLLRVHVVVEAVRKVLHGGLSVGRIQDLDQHILLGQLNLSPVGRLELAGEVVPGGLPASLRLPNLERTRA
mmetsp:Transcript_33379/g.81939  ORF Transcript_33379/g.81939 Transcript_33379/m.81939 type:complete len:211 (+) Transcript_33379:85-717(+)